MFKTFHAFWACALLICLSALGLQPQGAFGARPASTPAPQADWPVASPESQGVDSAALDAVADEITARRLNVHSVLVVRNGHLIYEQYFGGYDAERPHVQYSVTKSVISALTGAALAERILPGLDAPLAPLLGVDAAAQADPRKAQITLGDALGMSTGLEWEETQPYFALLFGADPAAAVLGLPQVAAPGAVFNYCSGCYHLPAVLLQTNTPDGLAAYAQQTLFDPLGIPAPTWETDRQNTPLGGWGLHLTPRQMARLGQLYLQEGAWESRQVIPAAWVRQTTTPRFTAVNPQGLGYGYGWWTMPNSPAFLARGRGGQVIYVHPERQLVVVSTAEEDGDVELLELIENLILPAAGDQTLPETPNATPAANPPAARDPWGLLGRAAALLFLGGLMFYTLRGLRRGASRPPGA